MRNARVVVILCAAMLTPCMLGACGSNNAARQETSEATTNVQTNVDNATARDEVTEADETTENASDDESLEVKNVNEVNTNLIKEEIAAFKERREKIDADEKTDPRLGGNMSQMREAVNEYAQLRTDLMNDLYAYLDALPEVDSEELAATQAEWEAAQQEELTGLTEAQKSEHRSGNAYGMDYGAITTSHVEQRLDELFALAESLI